MLIFYFSNNNHPCSAGTSQIKTRKFTLLRMTIIAIQTTPNRPAKARLKASFQRAKFQLLTKDKDFFDFLPYCDRR